MTEPERLLLRDLGCANYWKTSSPTVNLCRQVRKHAGYRRRVRPHSEIWEYGCEECGYRYTVDESG